MVTPEAVNVAAGKADRTMFSDITRTRLLGVSVVLAFGLAACGTAGGTGEDHPGGVASIGTDTTTAEDVTSDAPSDAEAPTDPNDAYLLYDQCMAEEGFPTDAAGQVDSGPSVATNEGGSAGGEGPTDQAIGPGGIEIPPEDIEEFEAANEVCRAHLTNVDQGQEFTPEQQAALEDAQLRMHQCLDAKGIDAQFTIGGGDERGLVENEESADEAPPANKGEMDQEETEAAMDECMEIFNEYPELADVLPPLPGS